jgi:hypothetical protein
MILRSKIMQGNSARDSSGNPAENYLKVIFEELERIARFFAGKARKKCAMNLQKN